jgi:hypothetical protein
LRSPTHHPTRGNETTYLTWILTGLVIREVSSE